MLYRTALFLLAALIAGCLSDPSTTDQNNSRQQPSSAPPNSLTKEHSASYSRADSSLGQTTYVPVYSHIYRQNHQMTFNLTATLSIRNTDLVNTITLSRMLYYDSEGKLVNNYLKKPISIGPLASTSFVVEEDDLRGGVGANFIVKKKAEKPVFPPIVEAVMISTSQQQGISFLSMGRVLENLNPDSLNPR